MKHYFLMASICVLVACQTQPVIQGAGSPEPRETTAALLPKGVPIYEISSGYQNLPSFFRVLGPVSCTGNAYSVANQVNECRGKICKGGTSCFTDSVNVQRQNKEFTPRINDSDAILFDAHNVLVGTPKGGAGVFVMNMFQNAGQDLKYVEVNGIAVQWATPTNEEISAAFDDSRRVNFYLQIQRPALLRTIRENGLVEQLPKLRAFLPDKANVPLNNWANSPDNFAIAEVLIDLKDPEAKSLSASLEKLLRYSADKKIRITSARLLLKLGNREVVESVAKETSDIQRDLKSLLLNS